MRAGSYQEEPTMESSRLLMLLLGFFFIMVCGLIVVVIPFWKITSRAGFSGWLSLLMLVPAVNIGFLFFLAFAPWPSLPEKTQMTEHG
jgi:uncharacterized membrane protein